MSPEALTQLILEYRYWLLVPLSLIEGPVIAVIAGTLAAVGLFNIYFLAVFFYVRDIILDLIYYGIGYYGGGTKFAERMLKKLGITPEHLGQVHDLWERRPATTMLIGKISYGIASAFIVVAGMVRMRMTLFLLYGSLAAVVQYWTLLALGYFFGAAFGDSIIDFVAKLQYVLLGAAVIIAGYYIVSWRARAKLLKADQEIEKGPPDEEPLS